MCAALNDPCRGERHGEPDEWWCWECNGQGTWPGEEVLDGDDPNCQCCGGDGYHRGGPCPISGSVADGAECLECSHPRRLHMEGSGGRWGFCDACTCAGFTAEKS